MVEVGRGWSKKSISSWAACQSYRHQLMERVMVAIKRKQGETLEPRGREACTGVETWGVAEIRPMGYFPIVLI